VVIVLLSSLSNSWRRSHLFFHTLFLIATQEASIFHSQNDQPSLSIFSAVHLFTHAVYPPIFQILSVRGENALLFFECSSQRAGTRFFTSCDSPVFPSQHHLVGVPSGVGRNFPRNRPSAHFHPLQCDDPAGHQVPIPSAAVALGPPTRVFILVLLLRSPL